MTLASLKIRPAAPADLPQLMSISQAGSAAHWTQQQWLDIFHTQTPPRLAWLAWDSQVAGGPHPPNARSRSGILRRVPGGEASFGECGAGECGAANVGSAIGFLVAQCGGPEWELENVAVLPAFRRRGVGAALLSALLAQARAQRAERIFLEVRASNHTAIRLYGQSGFHPLDRRRGYYQNPPEDALVFEHPLGS